MKKFFFWGGGVGGGGCGNPNPLNVYVWIKIYNYQVIAILWKQKKFNKHHINTTTQEHQILRGKPSNIEGKTTG